MIGNAKGDKKRDVRRGGVLQWFTGKDEEWNTAFLKEDGNLVLILVRPTFHKGDDPNIVPV